MVTIKNTVRLVSFDFEQGTFKGNGEARINADNALQQINGAIYKDSQFAGNFTSYLVTDGELKFGLSSVSADELAPIAELVNSVVENLKEQLIN